MIFNFSQMLAYQEVKTCIHPTPSSTSTPTVSTTKTASPTSTAMPTPTPSVTPTMRNAPDCFVVLSMEEVNCEFTLHIFERRNLPPRW